jgi:hypothetical protein
MAASPIEADGASLPPQDNWSPSDDRSMGPGGNPEPANGASLSIDNHHAGQDPEHPDYPRGSSVGDVSVSGSKGDAFREKQVKVLRSYPVCLLLLALYRKNHSGVWQRLPSSCF